MATNLIRAYVNHGRWIAECPECRWAIKIRPGFVDFRCGNCGLVAMVQWPSEREAIEEALNERSRIENRNWLPGETVIDLLAQTLERERA